MTGLVMVMDGDSPHPAVDYHKAWHIPCPLSDQVVSAPHNQYIEWKVRGRE
jgi:hypothetical protein